MRIFHKGLVLFGIPLVVEIALLSWLLFCLNKAEQDLDERAESLVMMGRSRAVASNLHEAFVYAGSYNLFHDDESKDNYLKKIGEAKDAFNDMERKMRENPKYAVILPRLRETWDEMAGILDQSKGIIEKKTKSSKLEIMMLAQELNHKGEAIADLFHEVFLGNESDENAQQNVERNRAQLRLVLYSGVAVNILMAALLLTWFSKSISQRIGGVATNSLKLARGEVLNPPITGGDEIAELDQVFHQMASVLKEASDREQAIFDNAVDIICSLDTAGRITRMNLAFETALGYPVEETLECHLVEFVTSDAQTETYEYLQKVRKEPDRNHNQEIRMRTADGVIRDFMWSSRWEPSQDAIYCIAHDITERKELEAAKQEFVAMVSHDLRSPLTSIRVSLGLFLNGVFGEPSEKAKKRLEAMDDSLERLIRLINNLLDIEKIDAGKMELQLAPHSASQMVSDAVESVRGMADEQKVELRAVAREFRVMADRDRIVQVLVNLLSNAIKFSPPESAVEVRSLERDGYVEFRVVDKGKGIPESMRQQIFEKFKQVDTHGAIEKKGTGLGLAICKNIIDAHGGTIGVDSEIDQGSQFWFRLRKLDASEINSQGEFQPS